MRTKLIAATALALFAVACGNAGIPNPTSADELDTESSAPLAKVDKTDPFTPSAEDELLASVDDPALEAETAEMASPAAARKVGDLSVHRFSGSFAKAPITLSEEVVAMAGSLVVVDYTMDQGKKHSKLRVTHDSGTDRVLRVREIRGAKELPSSVEAYEAMMAKTQFIPDDNEQQLGTEKTTCTVGGKALECEKTSYRVRIGDEIATLSVTRSASLEGRDVTGEIASPDGKVFYRAELVDTRAGTPSGVASR